MHQPRQSTALKLPGSIAGWDRYYRNLSEGEKERLGGHTVTVGRGKSVRTFPIVIDGRPNEDYLRKVGREEDGPRMGWNEFSMALWTLFDEQAEERLEEAGVAATAEDDRGIVHTTGLRTEDAASTHLARTNPDAIPDCEERKLMERLGIDDVHLARKILSYYEESMQESIDQGVYDRLRKLVAYILQFPNIKVAIGAMMFVFRLGPVSGFPTQTAYGEHIGLTRATISKATKTLAEILEIPAKYWSNHMKSAEACQKLSEAQSADHWRRRKFAGQIVKAA